MKHIWIICLLVVCSCNTVKEDFAVNEDYEKLFPPKEIEKPANKRCSCNCAILIRHWKVTNTPVRKHRMTLNNIR